MTETPCVNPSIGISHFHKMFFGLEEDGTMREDAEE
jgi:hypothetical protein